MTWRAPFREQAGVLERLAGDVEKVKGEPDESPLDSKVGTSYTQSQLRLNLSLTEFAGRSWSLPLVFT